jgi:hypothetical protein
MKQNIFLWTLLQELIGWIITASVAYVLLLPIIQKIEYKYLIENGLFIVVGITYLRYFVFFNSISFLQPNWLRFILFTANWVLWVYILNRVEMLLQLYDEFDVIDFGMPHTALSSTEQRTLLEYLYKEILLSGLVALLAIALFNIRIIGAYWRVAKVRFSQRMQE